MKRTPPKRRGRPPGSTAEGTRERILQVAREKFSELGFENANYEEIGRLAGLSRTALYNHFPTKADLYRALYGSVQDSVFGRMIDAAPPTEAGFRHRMAAFFVAAADINTQDPTHARFIATSLVDGLRNPSFAELAHAEAERTLGFFRDAVADAVGAGELPPEIDQEALVALLTSTLWGFGIYSAFIGTTEQVGAAVDLLGQLIERSTPAG